MRIRINMMRIHNTVFRYSSYLKGCQFKVVYLLKPAFFEHKIRGGGGRVGVLELNRNSSVLFYLITPLYNTRQRSKVELTPQTIWVPQPTHKIIFVIGTVPYVKDIHGYLGYSVSLRDTLCEQDPVLSRYSPLSPP